MNECIVVRKNLSHEDIVVLDERKCQFRHLCRKQFMCEIDSSKNIEFYHRFESHLQGLVNPPDLIENQRAKLTEEFSNLLLSITNSLLINENPLVLKNMNILLNQKLNPIVRKLNALDFKIKRIESYLDLYTPKRETSKETDSSLKLLEQTLLEEKYRGKFVAIHNNKIIEFSSSFEELHEIINKNHPGEQDIRIRYIEKGVGFA